MHNVNADNSSDTPRDGRRGRRVGRVGYGFALVEVLIAIFILAIGMISVATVFPVAIHQSRSANDDIVGQMVGKQALALLKAKGLTGVRNNGSSYEADGSVFTRGMLIEGFVSPIGTLTFEDKRNAQSMGATSSQLGAPTFGIPTGTSGMPQAIWANEMVWPSPSAKLPDPRSGLPDPNLPLSDRPLAFPEAERFPQYAWKVALYKPDPMGSITATIFVYRVRNWQAYWEGRWESVFPVFDQVTMGESLDLDPGEIVVKGSDRRAQRSFDPKNDVGIGAVWRIVRKRPDLNNPFVADYGPFAGKLAEGVVKDARVLDKASVLYRLPSGELDKVRLVAVVSGELE